MTRGVFVKLSSVRLKDLIQRKQRPTRKWCNLFVKTLLQAFAAIVTAGTSAKQEIGSSSKLGATNFY
jgi:hypothetical protein